MLKLARALGVLFGVLILLYAIDLALLIWWTSDPMIARLDAATPPGAALPPPRRAVPRSAIRALRRSRSSWHKPMKASSPGRHRQQL